MIQVFGRKDSQPTRRCLRFFKERRLEVSFVDLSKRAPAPAELRRFSDRLGASALLDTDSKPYKQGGLGYLRMDEQEVLERILAQPQLLRLPLVRFGTEVTAGVDEATWRDWQQGRQGPRTT